MVPPIVRRQPLPLTVMEPLKGGKMRSANQRSPICAAAVKVSAEETGRRRRAVEALARDEPGE